MDLSSMAKKYLKVCLIVLGTIAGIAFLLTILFAPFLGRIFIMFGWVSGPYNNPGSIWVSNEPEIYMEISPSHRVDESTCYVVVDQEKIPVWILVQPDRPYVFIESVTDPHTHLLTGDLLSCSKNSFVFKVTEDELFSGKYEEITLVRQK